MFELYSHSRWKVLGRNQKSVFHRQKTALNRIKSLVTNRSVSESLRIKLEQTYVWPTVLYGCQVMMIIKEI